MSVTFGGNRLIIGTGVKVDLNAWDASLQRIQPSYPGAQDLNNCLLSLEEIAGKTMEALKSTEKEISPENFRQLFKHLKPKYSSGFFTLFYEFMESNSSSWSSATYRKIRTLYNLLRDFENHSLISITFHTLDTDFLNSFTSFCQEKGHKYSTIYRSVNNLIWFLNWATDRGYNVYRHYRQFYKMMNPPEEKARIPLSLQWTELIRFHEYSTDHRRMERVRDLFSFMCFSGIRYSELQRLKKEDLKEEKVHIRRPGGGVRVVPMNKHAMQIRQKYENRYYRDNTAFPSVSLITMNKYLRIIGRDAGLKRLIYMDISGGEAVPIYSRLTAGLAVNTFIRNAIELEVPIEVISMLTGVQNDSRVRRIKSDLGREEIKKFNA